MGVGATCRDRFGRDPPGATATFGRLAAWHIKRPVLRQTADGALGHTELDGCAGHGDELITVSVNVSAGPRGRLADSRHRSPLTSTVAIVLTGIMAATRQTFGMCVPGLAEQVRKKDSLRTQARIHHPLQRRQQRLFGNMPRGTESIQRHQHVLRGRRVGKPIKVSRLHRHPYRSPDAAAALPLGPPASHRAEHEDPVGARPSPGAAPRLSAQPPEPDARRATLPTDRRCLLSARPRRTRGRPTAPVGRTRHRTPSRSRQGAGGRQDAQTDAIGAGTTARAAARS